MGLDRRAFLRQLTALLAVAGGSTIAPSAAWGTTTVNSLPKPLRQNLRSAGKRKLALLVGVDRYPHQPKLNGCAMDVQLQADLLIHRFGFAPSDVVTLTDQQASREAIETTFTEHLIQQAQPGDQVVFHFSGYGTQVHVPSSTNEAGDWVNALLPQDGDSVEGVSNCVLEQTLLLLVRALATTQCTVILDTAYSNLGQAWPGAWRSRSNPDLSVVQPSQAELAFAQKLRLNRPRKVLNEQLSWSALPTSIITMPGAIEGQWQGFSAGLLTSALVQWLWASTEPTTTLLTLAHLHDRLTPVTHRTPQLEPASAAPLSYTQTPTTAWGGEGYINTRTDAQTANLTITGLTGEVWSNYGARSQFQVLDAQGQPEAVLELRSKTKLQGKAVLVSGTSPLTTGQIVQERVRCFPRNLGLAIALDRNLQRIERVDATSVLAGVAAVSNVALAGEQPADYLFAKRTVGTPVTVATTKAIKTPIGYGLFSVGGLAIPKTAGTVDEAVIVAINRIVPALETLLATKWWRLLLNETASQLPAAIALASLVPEDPNTVTLTPGQPDRRQIVHHYSQRCTAAPASPQPPSAPSLPLGTRVCYRLTNPNDFPLYALVLAIDSQGSTSVFVAQDLHLSQPHLKIAPNSTLTLPGSAPDKSPGLMLRSPGHEQVFVFLSRQPWRQATQILEQDPATDGVRNKMVELKATGRFTQAMLDDLHQASLTWEKLQNIPADQYALHNHVWAGFRIAYTVA